MKRAALLSVAAFAIATSAHLAAQTGGTMAKDKSYTGCVAAGAMSGSYMLTHAMTEMVMNHDAMGKDSMKKDSMSKDAMAKEMSMAIDSKAVDLSKHVGHKVTVTGMDAPMGMAKPDAMGKTTPMFNVATVKMVATTCGM